MKVKEIEKFAINSLDENDETFQARFSYDEAKIDNLSKDIERFGQRAPIGIRKSPKNNGKFQIIYGFQRVKACKLLGRHNIRAAIYEDVTNRECRELSVRDNEMHGDLSPIEKALQCYGLRKDGWTVKELCESFNVNKSTIYNWFEVAKIKDDILLGLAHEGRLSLYHVLEIAKEGDYSKRLETIRCCLIHGWSVRGVRQWIETGRSPTYWGKGGFNEYVQLCPIGPSIKSIAECEKCQFYEGRSKGGWYIKCGGLDQVHNSEVVKKFVDAWYHFHRKSLVNKEALPEGDRDVPLMFLRPMWYRTSFGCPTYPPGRDPEEFWDMLDKIEPYPERKKRGVDRDV